MKNKYFHFIISIKLKDYQIRNIFLLIKLEILIRRFVNFVKIIKKGVMKQAVENFRASTTIPTDHRIDYNT